MLLQRQQRLQQHDSTAPACEGPPAEAGAGAGADLSETQGSTGHDEQSTGNGYGPVVQSLPDTSQSDEVPGPERGLDADEEGPSGVGGGGVSDLDSELERRPGKKHRRHWLGEGGVPHTAAAVGACRLSGLGLNNAGGLRPTAMPGGEAQHVFGDITNRGRLLPCLGLGSGILGLAQPLGKQACSTGSMPPACSSRPHLASTSSLDLCMGTSQGQEPSGVVSSLQGQENSLGGGGSSLGPCLEGRKGSSSSQGMFSGFSLSVSSQLPRQAHPGHGLLSQSTYAASEGWVEDGVCVGGGPFRALAALERKSSISLPLLVRQHLLAAYSSSSSSPTTSLSPPPPPPTTTSSSRLVVAWFPCPPL